MTGNQFIVGGALILQIFLNFERDYPGAAVVKLEQNYRSTKPILDAAHNVITKNTNRTDKKLITDKHSGLPVQLIYAGSELHEAETIITRIRAAVEQRSRLYKDMAILYRTNAQSRAIEEMCIRYNVPYRIVGGTRFYDRKEIKDIIAYLRLMYQPFDRPSFARIVNVPSQRPRCYFDRTILCMARADELESHRGNGCG
jgi:DNA helicase-2/ATP-dependent DNA helicase PcrA